MHVLSAFIVETRDYGNEYWLTVAVYRDGKLLRYLADPVPVQQHYRTPEVMIEVLEKLVSDMKQEN